ncbi:MAG: hypothetical protein ICV60_05970 [Pyrinomonadaceae bacterium]|nr:hypothetical protein [Pyrinomonadaceae bacterium]
MRTYSKESYRHLLRLALNRGYKIVDFLDETLDEPRIYLRLDVDRSLSMAVEIAEVNASLDVRGTFCLLLRSPNYNLLSYSELEQARRIHALGQHLALHYALPPEIPASDEEFADLIRAEFALACEFLPEMQPAFSWHDPTPEVLERGLKLEIPGYVNMYHERFFKEIPYFSDSCMRHTVAEFEKIIEANHPAMQLLFHPLFWVVGGADFAEGWALVWQRLVSCQTHPALGTPDEAWRGFVEKWYRAFEDN